MLDVDRLPNNLQNESTICASGFIEKNTHIVESIAAEKLSAFVTKLSEEDFKTLCFFKPLSDGKVMCRFSHSKNNVITCTRKGSKESYAFRCMRMHLTDHHITKTTANGKSFAITNNEKISLTKMVMMIFTIATLNTNFFIFLILSHSTFFSFSTILLITLLTPPANHCTKISLLLHSQLNYLKRSHFCQHHQHHALKCISSNSYLVAFSKLQVLTMSFEKY